MARQEMVGGWADQWRQGTLAMRCLGHVGAAAVAASVRPRGRRWPVAAALAGSLAADAALASRAGTPRRSRVTEVAANAVDLSMWGALAGHGRVTPRPAVVATVVPSTIESSFRAGAGTDAVPVMEPARPWTPAWDPPMPRVLSLPWSALARPGAISAMRQAIGGPPWPRPIPARALRVVSDLAADAVPPLVAAWAIRRLQGRSTAAGLAGWAVFAAAGGYALARTRDDAQRSTRSLWQRRSEDILEEQRVVACTQSALAHNLLQVDPRTLLRALAADGSTPAEAALAVLDDATRDTARAGGPEGTTLLGAVEGRPVVPAEDRLRFVGNEQVGAIRRWLDDVEDRDLDVDGPIEVVQTRGSELTLRYGCQELALQRRTPELAIRLDPTVPALLVGMVWSALTALPGMGGAPLPAVALAEALHGTAAYRLASRGPLERRADRTTVLLVGGAAVAIDLAVGLRQRDLWGPGGLPSCPGTGATQPLALLLGAGWQDLGSERWPLAAVGLGAWSFSLLAAGHRSRWTLLCELAFLLMPAAAAATMTADVRREAAALDESLDRWLAAALEGEAQALARRQVERYAEVLDTVAAELAAHPLDLEAEDLAVLRRQYLDEAARLRSSHPLDVINW